MIEINTLDELKNSQFKHLCDPSTALKYYKTILNKDSDDIPPVIMESIKQDIYTYYEFYRISNGTLYDYIGSKRNRCEDLERALIESDTKNLSWIDVTSEYLMGLDSSVWSEPKDLHNVYLDTVSSEDGMDGIRSIVQYCNNIRDYIKKKDLLKDTNRLYRLVDIMLSKNLAGKLIRSISLMFNLHFTAVDEYLEKRIKEVNVYHPAPALNLLELCSDNTIVKSSRWVNYEIFLEKILTNVTIYKDKIYFHLLMYLRNQPGDLSSINQYLIKSFIDNIISQTKVYGGWSNFIKEMYIESNNIIDDSLYSLVERMTEKDAKYFLRIYTEMISSDTRLTKNIDQCMVINPILRSNILSIIKERWISKEQVIFKNKTLRDLYTKELMSWKIN